MGTAAQGTALSSRGRPGDGGPWACRSDPGGGSPTAQAGSCPLNASRGQSCGTEVHGSAHVPLPGFLPSVPGLLPTDGGLQPCPSGPCPAFPWLPFPSILPGEMSILMWLLTGRAHCPQATLEATRLPASPHWCQHVLQTSRELLRGAAGHRKPSLSPRRAEEQLGGPEPFASVAGAVGKSPAPPWAEGTAV